MKKSSVPAEAAPHDALLLARVQQRNQAQILGKLLHDLRNPVHSLRVTLELFARLADPQVDVAALRQRAARYAPPAQAALAALSAQVERLSVWLRAPAAPRLESVRVNEWLADLALLLRESDRRVQASVESSLDDHAQLLADIPRLSHAVLQWGLARAGRVILRAVLDGADRIRIELDCAAPRQVTDEAFTAAELRTLIEAAGGRIEPAAARDADSAALNFERGFEREK